MIRLTQYCILRQEEVPYLGDIPWYRENQDISYFVMEKFMYGVLMCYADIYNSWGYQYGLNFRGRFLC